MSRGEQPIASQSHGAYCGPMWCCGSSLGLPILLYIWPGLVFHFLPQDTTPVESTLPQSTLIPSYPRVPLRYLHIERHGLQRPV